MSPSLLALTGLGLLLGFRHAFEPDHLAAVSTLATRQGRLLDACRLGLAWAVGHTASVGVVVAVIMIFGIHLPDRLWPAADFLVALLLIGLGASVMLRYARGRWHLHVHAHDGDPHLHLHSHAHGTEHAHAHPGGDARRSLGFGLLHGLAASAATAAAPDRLPMTFVMVRNMSGMRSSPMRSVSPASGSPVALNAGARLTMLADGTLATVSEARNTAAPAWNSSPTPSGTPYRCAANKIATA